MSDDIEEQLSALLDEELPTNKIRGISQIIGENEQLRGAWERYHLIGDVMRGEGVRFQGLSVADRVSERLRSESPILAAPKPAHRSRAENRWLRPAAGAAIAASVAVAAVYSLPRFIGLPDIDDSTQVAAVPVAISPEAPGRSGTRWKNLSEPRLESRLNSYLVNHNEYAAPGGFNGLIPYTSFVSYDSGRP